jgi:hypothetical protein
MKSLATIALLIAAMAAIGLDNSQAIKQCMAAGHTATTCNHAINR